MTGPRPTKSGWHCRLEFKLEDMWVGAFWKNGGIDFDLWVCLLPCLPIHVFYRADIHSPKFVKAVADVVMKRQPDTRTDAKGT